MSSWISSDTRGVGSIFVRSPLGSSALIFKRGRFLSIFLLQCVCGVLCSALSLVYIITASIKNTWISANMQKSWHSCHQLLSNWTKIHISAMRSLLHSCIIGIIMPTAPLRMFNNQCASIYTKFIQWKLYSLHVYFVSPMSLYKHKIWWYSHKAICCILNHRPECWAMLNLLHDKVYVPTWTLHETGHE